MLPPPPPLATPPPPPRETVTWPKKHTKYSAPKQITSQRLLDQSQAGVYRGKHHIPPILGLFGPIPPTPRG